MITQWLKRLAFGGSLALLLALTAVNVGWAQEPAPPADTADCGSCHETITNHWAQSGHSQASTARAFLLEWKKANSPGECLACHTTGFDPATGTWAADGITCTACHGPVPADHPNQVMPVDSSSRFCGQCHLDTYAEWQVSAHGAGDMSCVKCHNPHATDLKKGSIEDLCRSCHNAEVHFFSMTSHAQAGLVCTDCHLRVSGTPMGEGHGQREHTFLVDLASCTQCHGGEMHSPLPQDQIISAAIRENNLNLPPAVETTLPDQVTVEPSALSSLYLIVTAVIGVGLGFLVAPGIERWYRGRVSQG